MLAQPGPSTQAINASRTAEPPDPEWIAISRSLQMNRSRTAAGPTASRRSRANGAGRGRDEDHDVLALVAGFPQKLLRLLATRRVRVSHGLPVFLACGSHRDCLGGAGQGTVACGSNQRASLRDRSWNSVTSRVLPTSGSAPMPTLPVLSAAAQAQDNLAGPLLRRRQPCRGADPCANEILDVR